MINEVKNILEFIKLAEKLKCELRHSWLSDGRRESVAEHCWQMSLMAILIHNNLEKKVDITKTLKMIIIHDLVESVTGDIPYFYVLDKKQKRENEEKAIDKIFLMLNPETGNEIKSLWYEFENLSSDEAGFARALDNLEVQIQHNLADFNSWEEIEYGLVYSKIDKYCEHDKFLNELCQEVKRDSEYKMLCNGVDINKVKEKL